MPSRSARDDVVPESSPGQLESVAGAGAEASAARPLRVLHVVDSLGLYGAERVLLELASEHRGLGHDPVIASIAAPGAGENAVERAACQRGLPVRRIPMSPGADFRAALRLLRLARAEDADIIHTHGLRPNILGGVLPRWLRGVPLVATVHGNGDRGGFNWKAFYNRLNRLALRRADRVVLVHAGLRATRGLNRLQGRRWRVIENGIPDTPAAAPASSAERSARLDHSIVRFCARGSVVVGAVGRLSGEKAFHVLLRAVGEIARDRDDVVTVILGEGPRRERLERLVADLGLGERVLLPGYRDNARDYLHLFDVFTLSSSTEGLPLVVLEAMQAGVPIVATEVGGVADVLDGGRGGLLVEPGDARALAKAIRRCIEDPRLASKLAAHARTQQSLRFRSQVMARRYLALYGEVGALR